MGSSSQTTQQSSQSSPWAPQAGALESAFGNAQNAYNTASQAKAPTDFVAGMTPEQIANYQAAIGYANNSTIPGQNASTGGALSQAGTDATTGALTGLSNYNPSSANNPQTLVDAANQYVSGQNIPAQVKAAMQNATEMARDVTLPQITQNAANSGNANSSRAGIAQGIVQRGLAEQSANLENSLTGQAFSNGLSLASGNANANNQAALSALTSQLSGGTNAAQTGIGANSQSINDQNTLFGIANDGGTGLQNANQTTLNNLLAQYQSQVSSPYDALSGLMGIIGSNNWGSQSSGTATTTKDPSVLSDISGGIGAATSLAKLFSDRRIKEDIKRVGTLDNGLPVYTFRYKGLPTVHMGLMAQDVEKVHPDCVDHVFGIKRVDYLRATQ